METTNKSPISRQELIQIVEKAKLQTKGQAVRVIDEMFGLRPAPSAKKDGEARKLQTALSPELDKKFEEKEDRG